MKNKDTEKKPNNFHSAPRLIPEEPISVLNETGPPGYRPLGN
jgi:hypothetical protein